MSAPLHHDVTGDGPAVLLLHPGVADRTAWDAQLPALSRGHRVIRCDLAGFGGSAIPARAFSHHDEVARLLDHLDVERAHVVGASFGGAVALDLALAHPARAASLVLIAPALGGEEPPEGMRAFGAEEARLLEAGDLDAAAELNVRTWVVGPHRAPASVDPALRERVRCLQRAIFEVDEPAGAEEVELDPPAASRLGEVGVPALVIDGELDTSWMHEWADLVVSGIRGCERRVVPGAAHLPAMESPDRVDALLLDFLARAVARR